MSHETFKAPELEHLAELLPAYDFESFIAQGGMGAVYKATQRSLDRAVAIKILPREFGENPGFRESFETEAKAMAKLNHPNLLGVYDYGTIEGMPYIVMEFVDGKSLYHSAWNKIIDPEQAVEIVLGICDGLGHAHEHGILHRDIKPANILLTSKAQPKIGDFGLAQPTDTAGSGEVMGTPGYAAPELIHNPKQAGIGTDIYAVGVILHELITGQRPDPTGAEKPQSFGDHGLDAIWKKATDPQMAKRYHSAQEMAAALSAWKPSSRRFATKATSAPRALVAAPTLKKTAAPAPAPRTTAPAVAPAVAPAKATTPRPVPQLVVPTGTNWSLARNMLIIAFLIAVIGFGVKMLQRAEKTSTTEDDAAKKELFEKNQKAEADKKRKEIADATSPPKPTEPTEPAIGTTPKPPVTPPPVAAKKETPTESLARLKEDLAKGNRDEMPSGSKRRGTNDFFFVETPMTWYAAQAFAEAYGAQLAILESNEELTWLSQIVPDDQSIWLGSGRAERNSWVDNDGSDWSLEEEPKGVGPFATVNKLGVLRAGKSTDTLPFVIQWHRDGSNPGTLKTILERTRETLHTPNPIYPPGTISLGARQIIFLPVSVNRAQAEALATMASGILAVPSSSEEIRWMADESEGIEASTGYWLGGQRKDGSWSWDTGEVWEKAAWIGDAEPNNGGDALIFIPGKGWSNADPSTPVAGLVIEWSRDAPSK